MTIKEHYNKLYRYCTTAKVHGQLYKERLKELQQLTVKELKRCQRRKCRRHRQLHTRSLEHTS